MKGVYELTQMSDLVDAYDLTMPMDAAIRTYGNELTILSQSVVTVDDLQTMSSLELSPHANTHIDLPGNLTLHLDKEVDISENTGFFHSIFSGNCIIVDISSYYADVIYRALDEVGLDISSIPTTYCWNPGQIRDILEELRISVEQISWLEEFRDCVIVFYTGWRQFAPKDGDLHAFSWVPWHPYLLHPYLDHDSVRYLIGTGEDDEDNSGPKARGIGCDVYGLDSPLRYLFPLHVTEGSLCEQVKKLRQCPPENSRFLTGDEAFWPLHIEAMCRKRKTLLIEQLYIPKELLLGAGIERSEYWSYRRGRIAILPFRFSYSKDATIALALFTTEGWCEND